ncbi:39S ribosomal protein L43, mitochondrial [Tyrophagus putrescentiae]|nr:39S ribosomal protein L43, mitochondrial [Tyrophagus putrescentiae]
MARQMKVRDLIKFSLCPRVVEDQSLPVGYIRNAYYNGVGRYVCQLQRLTIKFCKNSQSSRGVRDYVENGLLDFSRQNPGVALYIKPRHHRSPVITADYLNGQTQWMSIRNFSSTEIQWWLETLRTRSGYELSQLITNNNVLTPSVQGVWTPFLNRPTNLLGKRFPDEERSAHQPGQPSASQQLIDLMEKYKLSAKEAEENTNITTEEDKS